MLHMAREWTIQPPHPERQRLADDAGIPPLLAQLLLYRGVREAADIPSFLCPRLDALFAPEETPGVARAANLIAEAARAGAPIVIYGDYDVDGVTATTILWQCLKASGANVEYYLPNRLDEGYGLNSEALARIAGDGARLVISVDCGITAVEEARRARALGLTLVITDHHQAGPILPDAAAIVHPTACGERGPNPDLSGAGVAFKLAWALAQLFSGSRRVNPEYRDLLVEATALAALGLIADVVPLTGENRVIASHGLRQLRHTRNAGLRALIEVAGLTGKLRKSALDDYDVGFALAPRLNAVGRMGHARLAVELLTRATERQARQIAETLDGHNRKRQAVEREILRGAEDMVKQRGFDRDGYRGIVLASRDWHPGVIGIVASRLVEKFSRPTVLIALDESGEGQGSGRSVRHFPLHEVLAECGELLISHGGHAMAAGLRLREANLKAFEHAYLAQAAKRLTPGDLRPRLALDDEVELEALSPEVVDALTRMAPFGMGNPRPRLATGIVDIADAPRTVGANGNHLQFTVRQNGDFRKVIAFNKASAAQTIAELRRLRLAFEPIINEWNGRRRVELKMIDWMPAGEA